MYAFIIDVMISERPHPHPCTSTVGLSVATMQLLVSIEVHLRDRTLATIIMATQL